MSKKLYTSCNLCSIPFLGHTDSTRLQMAAKQLNQALTHINCDVPKVIGSEFRHLTNNSTLFKLQAPSNGVIQYQNDEIMIVVYDVGKDVVEIYETPNIRVCSGLYSTILRYKKELGPFKRGDILYEYDSFNYGLPAYGYNAWTAYVPFFGFNHEDAIVVSESFCNRARATKSESITIPIYAQTLFKNIYPNSTLGFIPDIGQTINGNTLAMVSITDNKNVIQMLKSMSIVDFTSLVNNRLYFKSNPIPCRIKNGKIVDIKIHKISNQQLIDKQLQQVLENEYSQYLSKLRSITGDLQNNYNNRDFIKSIISSYYLLEKQSVGALDYNNQNLAYIIELKVAKENTTMLGDKLANRYANKGIISLILPDELRPIAMDSHKPIDILVGPISCIARMNWGQIPEGIISKAVHLIEDQIKINPETTSDGLMKLAGLANVLGDPLYALRIEHLASSIDHDPNLKKQFLNSVDDVGLYLEAPNFASFNYNELSDRVQNSFGINPNEPILYKRELIEFMYEKLGLKKEDVTSFYNSNSVIELPNKDIIIKDILTLPIYMLKLKQEASSKISSRDFGSYKSSSKQPQQGRSKNGIIANGSRLGQMEFDALLAHSVDRSIRELRTVKNESKSLKKDLIVQMTNSGEYHMPTTIDQPSSAIKSIIAAQISFINT